MWLCVYISDFLTFLISLVGVVIALIYTLKVWISFGSPKREEEYDKKLKEELDDAINNDRLNGVLKDYEISNREIQKRDNITLLIGSILITASLLVLVNTVSQRLARPISVYALVSIGLYFVWLIVLHDTSKKLDNLSYYRIKAIEKALSEKKHLGYEFGIHSYIFEKTRISCNETKPVSWLRLRRIFWGIILLLLSLAWMCLTINISSHF